MIVFPMIAFAGQSLVLSSSNNITFTDPIVSQNQSWRVEFQLHNFTLPSSGVPWLFNFQGLGAAAQLWSDGRLALLTRDSVQQQAPCFVNTTGITNALVRFQKNVGQMQFSCEIWNYDGTQYNSQFDNLATLNPGIYTGGSIGIVANNSSVAPVNAGLGFLRVATTLVPIGSKPPTTADAGDWTELKFDGNLKDSSGKGHNATGSAVYTATPNQVAIALPKTSGAPGWNNWATLRAGFPAQLDGTQSYSLADGGSGVAYSWQETSGPTSVLWVNRTAGTATISGLIFGTYDFTLQVTDVAGSVGTAPLEVGAVATDNNGVVVNADPNVDRLFGPMIAFGRNPWGYEDYWEYHAMGLRAADYQTQGWAPVPQWEKTGSGTVTYYWNGVGMPAGYASLGTKLASAIVAGSTTVPVVNAQGLDLTEFPTRILMWSSGTTEEIRICSASGNTLNVCYDGRGQSAQSWSAGTLVGQAKVTGSGTLFLTDPITAVCPLGASAPPGPASYTAGTVTLTPGSATVTGTGTSWAVSMTGSYIRVAATQSGNPFYFVAIVNTVNGHTTLTLNRPFPSDADSGTYSSYAVMPASRTIDLRYPHAVDPSGTGELLFATTGCESEDAVYLNPWYGGNSFASGHDIPALNGTLVSNRQYSVTDSSGWVNESSTGGINFYGESLASRSFYYRSGLTTALNAANVLDDYWIKSPWANADGSGYPRLFLGGGGIAAFASGILTGRVSWSDLRGYAGMGEYMVNGVYNGGNVNCEYDDTRDTGYAYAWLIMGALFDPDTAGFQARWRNDLATMQKVDTACKRNDNSWSNGFYWNANTGPMTLMSGSTAVTSTASIPSSACAGVSTGAGTVTNGSAAVNASFGSFPASGATVLVITGTLGGSPFTGSYMYSGSGTTATLAALWPGDSGNVTWMAENINPGTDNNSLTVFASASSDYTDLANNYACIWNSPTSLTLDHPWRGANGSNYYLYTSNLAGFGQQPYMLGIKTYGMNLLANASDPALAAYANTYSTFTREAVQWIHDNGYDPASQGINYGRVFPFCEPTTTPPAGSAFEARTPGCNYGFAADAVVGSRELNAEIANATSVLYNLVRTPANQLWGDTVYGSLWGFAPDNTGGVYSDSRSPASNIGLSNMTDNYIHEGKWYGFFTGMSMAHAWPAMRQGGVAPPKNRTVHVSFIRPLNAVTTQIVVTAPSGNVTTFPCAAGNSCPITVDDRQGSHWFRVQHLSASGQVVAQSDPDFIIALQ
jgi:hypothetical protein